MNANDVIELYVTDVAAQLPRKQRNDVAFELRALLAEELQGKADAAGRGADAAMALELVRAFGRPADVAARYRPTLTIIDPADGRAFLQATVIGLAIVWAMGLWVDMRPPIDSASEFLLALGRWWGATVIPSLWWPGVLVVSFGLSSWGRGRWPQMSEWKPRAGDRGGWSRATMVLALVGILCGLLVLLDPSWILNALFGGRLAPAAYEAVTYSETFRQRQAPWLLVLIALNVPMIITVIVNDRWSATMRRSRGWLGLVTSAVLAWTIVGGPVFVSPASDQLTKSLLALVIAITLLDFGVGLYRSVKPAPDRRIRD